MNSSLHKITAAVGRMLRRPLDWAFGPNGWLIGDDPNDAELAKLRASGARIPYLVGDIKDPRGRPLLAIPPSAGEVDPESSTSQEETQP